MPRLTLAAAVDTAGNRWYSLSQASSNTDTFYLFMAQLLLKLDAERIDWRKDTFFILDGAKYHTSAESRRRLALLGVPFLFTAPYSYRISPIELLFARVKQGELNPLSLGTTKR